MIETFTDVDSVDTNIVYWSVEACRARGIEHWSLLPLNTRDSFFFGRSDF